MARIEAIKARDQLAPEHRAAYDGIARSRGHVVGPFTALLHSPELAARTAALGAFIRYESALPAPARELAILATAREMECAFEWAAHEPEARRVGVRPEAIRAVEDGRAPADLDADEARLVSYVQQLARRHRVDDETFGALRERLGVPGLVELTATVGYYSMLAGILNAFEIQPADPSLVGGHAITTTPPSPERA